MKQHKTDFPYPFLYNNYGDYIDCRFDLIEENHLEKNSSIVFNFSYILQCDEIENLIKENKAKIIMQITCPTTALRISQDFIANEISICIEKQKINKKLTFKCMIVATETIKDFSSKNFNQDYFNGKSYPFNNGKILGRTNDIIFSLKEHDTLKSMSSIFEILPRNKKELRSFITADYEKDKIFIFLEEDLYAKYDMLRAKGALNAYLSTIIVLPALTEVMEEYKRIKKEDSEIENKWFIVIDEKFKDAKLDINSSTLELASAMLPNLFSDAINTLVNYDQKNS